MPFRREHRLPSILADKQKFSKERKTVNNLQYTRATIHYYPEKTIDTRQNNSLQNNNTNLDASVSASNELDYFKNDNSEPDVKISKDKIQTTETSNEILDKTRHIPTDGTSPQKIAEKQQLHTLFDIIHIGDTHRTLANSNDTNSNSTYSCHGERTNHK